MSTETAPQSSLAFKWWLCILLLLATTLNSMDRQALSQTSKRVQRYFEISNQELGTLESAFNAAFAIGALGIGWLVDRGNVRWIYPIAVVGWSMAGFAAGFAESYWFLLACRFWLGLFEAGNWPCGVLTVKRVLKPEARTLGNGMLHSGIAIGAITTPLVVNFCLWLTDSPPDSKEAIAWQLPFRVVGAAGLLWAVLWLLSVRSAQVRPPAPVPNAVHESYWSLWRLRRFWVLIVVIVSINLTWRSFQFWLPKFLQDGRNYSEKTANYLSSGFFVAADVGSISIGLLTLWLLRRGVGSFRVRMLCFGIGSTLTMFSLVAAALPPGLGLIMALFAVGAGAASLFPTYFALSQEISAKHQGKVTGTLGCVNALCLSVLFPVQGKLIDYTGSFTFALGIAGLKPIFGLLAVALFWNRQPKIGTAKPRKPKKKRKRRKAKRR